MDSCTYFQPTEIRYGATRLNELGEVVTRYGRRCLLVTVPSEEVFDPLFSRVRQLLSDSGVDCEHFDGVVPNPTTDCVTAGADMAKRFGAAVILGVIAFFIVFW